MWKTIVADDEVVLVNGLKNLIPWEELELELVGEATDGCRLYELIREKRPQIVITDVAMPEMTGLDVMRRVREDGLESVKFIFISGYAEFSYAQTALSGGAVDYLLKPVSRKKLEESIRKAQSQLRQRTAADALHESRDEFEELFESINQGNDFDQEALYELFSEEEIDFKGKFFAGICIGVIRNEKTKKISGPQLTLKQFSLITRLCEEVRDSKMGFVIRREEERLHIIGVFPEADRENFYEKYINAYKVELEKDFDLDLCVGIGMRTENASMLQNAYSTAKFAYELYFFDERRVIDFESVHRDYTVSFEDFQNGMDRVYHSILAKDGKALQLISEQMDMIERLHYGNVYAAKSRTMLFTGDLGMKLYNSRLLSGDFYKMQDELQAKVEHARTFRELRDVIMVHYENLLNEIYQSGKSGESDAIEDVKKYIHEHFNEELSVKELAGVACVSPNYFSALFKKETGQNYKTYLTHIRMEEALRLLMKTGLKTYEISERVGYKNTRRFVDAFKQIYGMSPMEYRKEHYKKGKNPNSSGGESGRPDGEN